MLNLNPDEIKKLVKDKYSDVSKNPCGVFNFPVGKIFALKVGYPKEVLDNLPPSLTESFTGANNPQPFVELKEGEIVLDLGCGAGLDLYFYAKAVGEVGKVYGLDISEDMVNKVKRNMELSGIKNAEISVGESDNLPFNDDFFDVVASNGIYNLSPDKDAVMREVYRVLKPGGRTVFCEIVLKEPFSEDERKNHSDWFRCIGGALVEKDFLALMEKMGFKDTEVISKCRNARTGHPLAICANIRAHK
ncbi:MAG: methyltransferase domain-containing protein [Candidatus Omnitrophota bacterium]|nr:methyltransferase domain-containing protein [Candidatus Omnitrophota bacterium]